MRLVETEYHLSYTAILNTVLHVSARLWVAPELRSCFGKPILDGHVGSSPTMLAHCKTEIPRKATRNLQTFMGSLTGPLKWGTHFYDFPKAP